MSSVRETAHEKVQGKEKSENQMRKWEGDWTNVTVHSEEMQQFTGEQNSRYERNE